ncbi:YegS/Rv2252/BmrU family lipid kinase [Leptolyngbya sp. FACHB-261]|uniref:YegS/Rv2252/BmrU family lipid kinase n=1 Tax=Leptolyngbya sp. FACHB-261 TaxID=2692806 RepID=UPI001684EFE9|nr:YegS/Rv2252/BmrU family lipid kinase [Leptolyngbya sp. FACHB-261]MBD2104794.1 YegS/Rv2252/BmrU family lipid kinase [Leptolyngbya sp. FACHB-261]
MSRRSACLIYNPVAGQGDSEADLQKIRELLEPEFDLDIRYTTEETDADELALAAVQEGVAMIIASGGDGTLSAAATALVGTSIPFGVISRGTANAFANALGIPDTIEEACETILTGSVRVVDAATCNGKPMVLLAGIGFEAEAVERADRAAKNRFGMLAYVLAGVQQLRQLEIFEAQIETDDKVVTVTAAAVTVANAAPSTSILAQGPAAVVVDDGMLDITIVAPSTATGAIAAGFHLLQTALQGVAGERPDIGYLRSRSVKITTDPPQKIALDGEIVGTTPVDIQCIPGGLTILVPKPELEPEPTEKLEGLPNLQVKIK